MTLGFQEMVISFRQVLPHSAPSAGGKAPREAGSAAEVTEGKTPRSGCTTEEEEVQSGGHKQAESTRAFPGTGLGPRREGDVGGSGGRYTCHGKQALSRLAVQAAVLFLFLLFWRGPQH